MNKIISAENIVETLKYILVENSEVSNEVISSFAAKLLHLSENALFNILELEILSDVNDWEEKLNALSEDENEEKAEISSRIKILNLTLEEIEEKRNSNYIITVTDIKWDTDGAPPEEFNLPDSVTIYTDELKEKYDIENDEDIENYIADYLSDEYGFCIFGCSLTMKLKQNQ